MAMLNNQMLVILAELYYPLVNSYIAMERSTIYSWVNPLYFYGNFQQLCKRIPEGNENSCDLILPTPGDESGTWPGKEGVPLRTQNGEGP